MLTLIMKYPAAWLPVTGALLIVDATQGVEAQTLANVYLALEHDLEIIPIINKIDLPSADPERVRKEIEDVIGLDASDAIEVSAKTGLGVDKVLEAIVQRIPAPEDAPDKPLRALIFDSHFDSYKGAIANIRIMEGSLKTGDRIRMMSSGMEFEVTETGVFIPQMHPVASLECGSVGYLAASMKNVRDCRVGDTVTLADRPAAEPLPGYRKATPMVYCGLYPVETNDYDNLRMPWKNCISMMRPCYLNRKHRRLWDSVPLRLPGTSPYGRRQGTAGTGVWSVSDYDGSVGYLSCILHRWHDGRRR